MFAEDRFCYVLDSVQMECYATPIMGKSNFYFFTDLYYARIGLNAQFALSMREAKKGHLVCRVKILTILIYNLSLICSL